MIGREPAAHGASRIRDGARVLAGLVLGIGLAGTALSADRYEEARSERSVPDARIEMERVLNEARTPAPSAASAAIWLGQYEYALGRLEPALAYFLRALELAPEEDPVRDRSLFWATHTANLLEVPLPPSTSLSTGSFAVGRDLAEGDAEVRAGKPRAAMRRYLEIEGGARAAGWLGPLAFRAALVAGAAQDAGESDAIFDLGTIDRWDPELRISPERGLIASRVRGEERIAPVQESASEFTAVTARPDEGSGGSREWGDEDSAHREAEAQAGVGDGGSAEGDAGGDRPPGRGADLFVIQLGAFRDRDVARVEMERLTARGLSVRLERGLDSSGERIYRIRLGGPQSRDDARRLAERLLEGLDFQLVAVEP